MSETINEVTWVQEVHASLEGRQLEDFQFTAQDQDTLWFEAFGVRVGIRHQQGEYEFKPFHVVTAEGERIRKEATAWGAAWQAHEYCERLDTVAFYDEMEDSADTFRISRTAERTGLPIQDTRRLMEADVLPWAAHSGLKLAIYHQGVRVADLSMGGRSVDEVLALLPTLKEVAHSARHVGRREGIKDGRYEIQQEARALFGL